VAKTHFDLFFGRVGPSWLKYPGTAECKSVSYGDSPPDVTDKVVFVLDFSFPRAVLSELKSKAKRIITLDHHATAMNELKDEEDCFFHLDFSGAMLAYKYFWSATVPAMIDVGLIEYVQDKDLWRWELPYSEEINLALETIPFDFKVWKNLRPVGVPSDELVTMGRSLVNYRQTCVDRCVDHVHWAKWMGCDKVGVVNASAFSNEISDTLLKRNPDCDLCLTWYYNHEKKKCKASLRSRKAETPVDAGAICKRFGGGGHPNAGGFFWPGCDVESLLEDPRTWDLTRTRAWLKEIGAKAVIPVALGYNLTMGVWFQMYSYGATSYDISREIGTIVFDNLEKRWSHLFSDHQLAIKEARREKK
jgi:hypothetical protein